MPPTPGSDETEVEKDIAIVGMGPGGMAAALALAEKGKKVTIFESRTSFTRTQKVKLTEKSINFIQKLLKSSLSKYGVDPALLDAGDFSTINEKLRDASFESSEELAQIEKEIHIYERLMNDSHKGIKLNNLQSLFKGCMERLHSDKITIKEGVKISEVNSETTTISYSSKGDGEQTMEFSHLVGADGARHSVADMVRSGDELDLGYEDSGRQTRQKAHGTVRIAVDDSEPVRKTLPLKIEDLPALRKLGWDKPYLPKVYLWEDTEDNEYYIAGEIPDIILDSEAEDRTLKMQEWGKTLVALTTKHNPKKLKLPDDLDAPEADRKSIKKLSTTAFPVTMRSAARAAIELCSGHAFFSVGDAARTANFHLGHGTNDAIADGLLVAECISSAGLANISQYNKEHVRRKEKINTNMDYLRSSQMSREEQGMIDFAALEVKKGISEIKKYTKCLPASQKRELVSKIGAIKQQVERGNMEEAYKRSLESLDIVREAITKAHSSKRQMSMSTRLGIAIFNKICSPIARLIERKHIRYVIKADAKVETIKSQHDFVQHRMLQVKNELRPSIEVFSKMSYSKQKAILEKNLCAKTGEHLNDSLVEELIQEINLVAKKEENGGELDVVTLAREAFLLHKSTLSGLRRKDKIEEKVKSALQFSPCELSDESVSRVVENIKEQLSSAGRSINVSGKGYTVIIDAIYKEADLSSLKVEDLQSLSSSQLESIIRVTAEDDGKRVPVGREMKQIISAIGESRDISENAIDLIKSQISTGAAPRPRGDASR